MSILMFVQSPLCESVAMLGVKEALLRNVISWIARAQSRKFDVSLRIENRAVGVLYVLRSEFGVFAVRCNGSRAEMRQQSGKRRRPREKARQTEMPVHVAHRRFRVAVLAFELVEPSLRVSEARLCGLVLLRFLAMPFASSRKSDGGDVHIGSGFVYFVATTSGKVDCCSSICETEPVSVSRLDDTSRMGVRSATA